MAKADNTPADDDDDTDPSAGAGDSDTDAGGGDDDNDSGDESEVICTVVCIPDKPGQYRLIKGDEDDSGGAGEGDEDEQGTVYKGEGPLLKGILEAVRDYESEKAGGGSAQDNMMAGYGDEPPESQMQKYND